MTDIERLLYLMEGMQKNINSIVTALENHQNQINALAQLIRLKADRFGAKGALDEALGRNDERDI